MFAVRAGSLVQGFMPFPAFPGWLGKNSSRGKYKRLTQELVLHSSLSIGQVTYHDFALAVSIPLLVWKCLDLLLSSHTNISSYQFCCLWYLVVYLRSHPIGQQGFGAVRLEYVPYWRKMMLRPLLARGSEGAQVPGLHHQHTNHNTSM